MDPMAGWLERAWYDRAPGDWLLRPLSWIYAALSAIRRTLYRSGLLPRYRAPVPVWVVGNLSVGGTGKTPMVLWLLEELHARGRRPGVVSRGYGGDVGPEPRSVEPDSDPAQVGDEPLLIRRRCDVPVFVHADRSAAVRALLAAAPDVDIILADDGLQHYALQRDREILVVDGERRFGNARLLPAGPLREPPSRALACDLTVFRGEGPPELSSFDLVVGDAFAVTGGERRPLASFQDGPIRAVAGIGNPRRFFDALRAAGLDPETHAIPDHGELPEPLLASAREVPLLMTEKDAVRLRGAPHPGCWAVAATTVFKDPEPVRGAIRAWLDEDGKEVR